MKRKFKRNVKSLPLAVTIAMSATCASFAATIMPDGFGNVLITAGDSGANNIVVPAGQPAAFSPFEIRFDPNTFLTPTTAASIDIQDTAAIYTVNMGAGSSIDGGTNDGITSVANLLTVNASGGSISGANAISGGPGGTIVVVNDTDIIGTAGAGINSTGTVEVTNNFLQPTDIVSLIRGTTDGVVGTGNNSIISNFGFINAQGGDGIRVGDSATVSNLDVMDSISFNTIFSGQIDAQNNGVVAGDGLLLTNENLGQITGTDGNGITAGDNAEIINFLDGNIFGGNDGVNAGTALSLTNDGTITSDTGNGISAFGGGNTVITNSGTIDATSGNDGVIILNHAPGDIINNSGTITGGVNGVEFFNGSGGVLNNSGTITGGTRSIFGSSNDETLNLTGSSTLQGDVDGAGGVDTIAFGSSTLAPGNTGNSISGNITNIDSITKDGGGVALIGLPGDPLFTVNADTITVLPGGGGLYINGNINAEDGVSQSTFTSNGVAIGGTGTWNADVFVNTGGISAGAIPINLDADPTNAVGEVTITGGVVHQPGSFIRFDVDPNTGNTDLINQTGAGNTYTLNGADLRIASTDNNRVIQDGTYFVVESITGEEIIGNFGNVTVQLNPNVNAADTGFIGSQVDQTATGASNNSDTVLAIFTNPFVGVGPGSALAGFTIRHDFSSLVTDPNAAAFGNALDASVGSANAIDQDFIAALDFSDLATVQATLNAASPTASFNNAKAIISGNYGLNRRVQQHLASSRVTGNNVSSYGADHSTSANNCGNVWGSLSYSSKDIDSSSGNDFDGEESSFTAGIDFRVGPNLLLGILADGSTADYDFNGGDSDTDSFRAAIYGTYGQGTGIYVDFLAGYGTHDADISRNGGLLGTLRSSPDAESFQALLTVGYAMQSGSVKHGPFIGAEYQDLDVDGYTQNGAFPLAVDGYDVESLRLLVGYRLEMSAGKFSPYASVAYAHELEDDDIDTTATLPGGAGFGVSGSGLESSILISLGTNYAISDSLNLNIGYHGEISVDSDGIDSHGAQIGLNFSF